MFVALLWEQFLPTLVSFFCLQHFHLFTALLREQFLFSVFAKILLSYCFFKRLILLAVPAKISFTYFLIQKKISYLLLYHYSGIHWNWPREEYACSLKETWPRIHQFCWQESSSWPETHGRNQTPKHKQFHRDLRRAAKRLYFNEVCKKRKSLWCSPRWHFQAD